MKIVALSDTHGFHRKLVIPDADVLIHCGDITNTGETDIATDFALWLEELPHPVKIVVPGNHDFCFDISKSRYSEAATRAVREVSHFLIDSSVTIGGLKFYGSPWVPNLGMWAFHDQGRDRYVDAPTDVDVLVTHGPPYGLRDSIHDNYSQSSMLLADGHVGSNHLRAYVNRCSQLKAHVFGHIHEAYGVVGHDTPIFVNAAICTRAYEPTNQPVVFEVAK